MPLKIDAMAAARPDKAGKWSKSLIDVLEGVDNTLRGAEQVAVRGFGDMLKEAKVGPWTLDFGNKRSDAFFADVVREIYGANTGNGTARRFAQNGRQQWTAIARPEIGPAVQSAS